MPTLTTIGLDLAKRVFQGHGMDQEGRTVLRKKVRRGQGLKVLATFPPCLVGREACRSAHDWAREIRAQGHQVRLIPPHDVRPFLKTNKHDAADADAIAEAVGRPPMRFAPIKSADQQAVLMLHRARELLVKQRTRLSNAVRGHGSELGRIASQGAARVHDLLVMLESPDDPRLPTFARDALGVLLAQLHKVKEAIRNVASHLRAWPRSQQASQRLTTIPGVGVITATALVAPLGDGSQFQAGRPLSAWLGLVPRPHSSGGKSRLGRIAKRGDGEVRRAARSRVPSRATLAAGSSPLALTWDWGIIGQAADQCRPCGHGQPNGPARLGHDEKSAGLQRRGTGNNGERQCEGEADVMANKVSRIDPTRGIVRAHSSIS